MLRGSRLLLLLIVLALSAPGVLTATPPDGASWRTGRSSLPPGHVIGVPWLGAPPLFQASSADALPFGPGAPEQSALKTRAWKPAEAYGVEFGGAALGTAVAAVVSGSMMSAAYGNEDRVWLGLAAFPTYAVSSALLSATGTHLVGKLVGHSESFGHALAGGALGGLCGSTALFFYLSSPPRDALLPLGLVLPPLCAVVVYNVWKSRQSD